VQQVVASRWLTTTRLDDGRLDDGRQVVATSQSRKLKGLKVLLPLIGGRACGRHGIIRRCCIIGAGAVSATGRQEADGGADQGRWGGVSCPLARLPLLLTAV
jgi:hypothetical protein